MRRAANSCAAIGAEIADTQSRLHDEIAQRDAARHARNEAEVALARGREQLRAAERAAQEAGFAERAAAGTGSPKSRAGAKALAAQVAQQQGIARRS